MQRKNTQAQTSDIFLSNILANDETSLFSAERSTHVENIVGPRHEERIDLSQNSELSTTIHADLKIFEATLKIFEAIVKIFEDF